MALILTIPGNALSSPTTILMHDIIIIIIRDYDVPRTMLCSLCACMYMLHAYSGKNSYSLYIVYNTKRNDQNTIILISH